MPVALITGGSSGLGRAIAHDLLHADPGGAGAWHLLLTARTATALERVRTELAPTGSVEVIAGDVADPAHRDALATAVERAGRLDLLVNNAGDLGPSPLPRVTEVPLDAYRRLLEVNVVAPLALHQRLAPLLRRADGVVINISSDAASGVWPGWGPYGSSKAALDQLSAVAAVESPEQRIYALDPGDMRTPMHQAAFPGEDISDRPAPDAVAPAIGLLVRQRPPSGRYRAADLLAGAAA